MVETKKMNYTKCRRYDLLVAHELFMVKIYNQQNTNGFNRFLPKTQKGTTPFRAMPNVLLYLYSSPPRRGIKGVGCIIPSSEVN